MQINSTAGDVKHEAARRRTFAIISHPDAGKTTLTEKLLLYGGAIRQAGSVKARKAQRHATSDWMEIEKQRGISVTSSAMQFEYDGFHINILDTPGHQDFSEDTYRVLMAADSAVMLIDAAKGVEAQTLKLFSVCRMRGIPIFTFVNKMDRAGRDPFELMEEIERVLGIRTCPMNWPIGESGAFKGVLHRDSGMIELYTSGGHGRARVKATEMRQDAPDINKYVAQYDLDMLGEQIELLDIAGDAFDKQAVLRGELSPVFFGSAITNFGVEPFLERFLGLAPPPGERLAGEDIISPADDEFTAFVFKIQANMNPAHRDRLAFIRICSGEFKRGMTVYARGKQIKLTQPQQFMADEREMVELAYPGDIIGLFDPGIFSLGDTLSTSRDIKFQGIPLFAPEHFARVAPEDSLKRKQFVKGIEQLSQEGAIQTFRRPDVGYEEIIVGVVGVLQIDVLKYRLKAEYGVNANVEQLPFGYVRWVESAPVQINRLRLTSTVRAAVDSAGRDVLLFDHEWAINWAQENNPGLKLSAYAVRKD